MHWLLIGYMFLFIHRPFEFWTILGDIHIERIYILFVFFAWMLQPKRWFPNPQHFAYAAFAFAVLLCWAASPTWTGTVHNVEDWFKIAIVILLFVHG